MLRLLPILALLVIFGTIDERDAEMEAKHTQWIMEQARLHAKQRKLMHEFNRMLYPIGQANDQRSNHPSPSAP